MAGGTEERRLDYVSSWRTERSSNANSLTTLRSVQAAMTRLFQLRRFPELASELPILNEKLSKLSKSGIGQFIGEFYQVWSRSSLQ